MTQTEYTLESLARQRSAMSNTPRRQPTGFPRNRPRHALAEQFRRIADAIDT